MSKRCSDLPLVSVGIPTYRRPKELRAALSQMLEQTYGNIEIIVSENGSEDDEIAALVKGAQKSGRCIQFFKQERNIGPVANFQFVLERASGKYFMWCADDDWHAADFISHAVNLLEENPTASLAFCNFSAIDPQGSCIASYGDFLPRLEQLVVAPRWLRQWRYFMQEERLGKANLIYGLMNRRLLADMNWEVFVASHGWTGVDNLFVFEVLGRGEFVLSKEKLFASRVGNDKLYDGSFVSVGRLSSAIKWWGYLFQYVGMAPGPLKLMYMAGVVIKMARFTFIKIARVIRYRTG